MGCCSSSDNVTTTSPVPAIPTASQSVVRDAPAQTSPANDGCIPPSTETRIVDSGRLELESLFEQLKAKGLAEGGKDEIDSLQEGSFPLLAELLGVDLDDILMLVIPYKLGCKVSFHISRDEWMTGWTKLGALSLPQIRTLCPTLQQQVTQGKPEVFKAFYNFVFGFVKDKSQKSMDLQIAVDTWKTVLTGRWLHLNAWCDYVQNFHKKAVTQDLWSQLYEFILANDVEFSNYDFENGAWPVLIDEFVEFMRGKPANA